MPIDELKQKAIEHWEGNLKKLKELDWDWWKSLCLSERRDLGLDCKDNSLPRIYGDDCPYCEEFGENCAGCPLSSKGHDIRHCCLAWNAARDAFVNEPTMKDRAIEAFESMVKYIKERG